MAKAGGWWASIVEAVTPDTQFARQIQFTVDPREWEVVNRLLAEFPKQAPRMISLAVNRAAKVAQRMAIRIVAANLKMKQKDLDGRHTFGGIEWTRRATAKSPYAVVECTGSGVRAGRIPLYLFRPKPSQPPFGKREKSGVSYEIGERGRHRNRVAFIARGRKFGKGGKSQKGSIAQTGTSGHIGVFRRIPGSWHKSLRMQGPPGPGRRYGKKGEERITELYGPSIPQVADTDPQLGAALKFDVQTTLQKRLEGYLEALLKGQTIGTAETGAA